jgi:hypothetical protein
MLGPATSQRCQTAEPSQIRRYCHSSQPRRQLTEDQPGKSVITERIKQLRHFLGREAGW